jgi:hypothetical protein
VALVACATVKNRLEAGNRGVADGTVAPLKRATALSGATCATPRFFLRRFGSGANLISEKTAPPTCATNFRGAAVIFALRGGSPG